MQFHTLLAPLLLGAALLSAPVTTLADSAASSSQPTVVGFGEALNALRAQHGLGGLREERALTRAAQAYAQDMAAHGHFSHTGRDGSTVLTRARGAGCNGRGYFAENIAWGQNSANDAFQGWAASSGHLANMLGANYGAYGLGQSGGYWVLIFADGC